MLKAQPVKKSKTLTSFVLHFAKNETQWDALLLRFRAASQGPEVLLQGHLFTEAHSYSYTFYVAKKDAAAAPPLCPIRFQCPA